MSVPMTLGEACQQAAASGGTLSSDLDEFKMWELKVTPCAVRSPHDWALCPFAHPSERARRRHPSLHSGIACQAMKAEGKCALGNACPCAHSAWEYWLHPSRYKTTLCSQGANCNRQFCFFAHQASELHVPTVRPGSLPTPPPALAANKPLGMPALGAATETAPAAQQLGAQQVEAKLAGASFPGPNQHGGMDGSSVLDSWGSADSIGSQVGSFGRLGSGAGVAGPLTPHAAASYLSRQSGGSVLEGSMAGLGGLAASQPQHMQYAPAQAVHTRPQVLHQAPMAAPQAPLHQRLPPTPFDMPAPYSASALDFSAALQPQPARMAPGSSTGLDAAATARLVDVVVGEVVAGRLQLSQAVNVLSSILPAGAPAMGHLNHLLALVQQAQVQPHCQVQQQQQQRVAPAGAGSTQGQQWQGSAMEGQWLQPPTGWGL